MRTLAALALSAAVLAPCVQPAAAGPVARESLLGSPVSGYTDPPFTCSFTQYGEGESPSLDEASSDPLCVEYQKRDITADNGGAVRFMLAEPARFAIALPKCRYWQQDHWRIQVDRRQQHLVQWDGSYWFDKGSGRAASVLRNFRIDGHPADPGPVADLVARVSPELAQAMRSHGASASFGVPFDPRCAR